MFRHGHMRRGGKHNGLQRQNTSVLRMNTTFRPRRKKFTERCVNSLQQHVQRHACKHPEVPLALPTPRGVKHDSFFERVSHAENKGSSTRTTTELAASHSRSAWGTAFTSTSQRFYGPRAVAHVCRDMHRATLSFVQ